MAAVSRSHEILSWRAAPILALLHVTFAACTPPLASFVTSTFTRTWAAHVFKFKHWDLPAMGKKSGGTSGAKAVPAWRAYRPHQYTFHDEAHALVCNLRLDPVEARKYCPDIDVGDGVQYHVVGAAHGSDTSTAHMHTLEKGQLKFYSSEDDRGGFASVSVGREGLVVSHHAGNGTVLYTAPPVPKRSRRRTPLPAAPAAVAAA